MGTQRICSIADCGKKYRSAGLCKAHWLKRQRAQRRDRLGTQPPQGRPKPTRPSKLNSGVRFALLLRYSSMDVDECLIFPGAPDPDGYKGITFNGRKARAHRVMCILAHGAPNGRIARHRCDNPPCVNPKHLHWGTDADNVRDCMERGRFCIGENRAQAKLTNQQVLDIRASSDPLKMIAEKFGISYRKVRKIRYREKWKNVA